MDVNLLQGKAFCSGIIYWGLQVVYRIQNLLEGRGVLKKMSIKLERRNSIRVASLQLRKISLSTFYDERLRAYKIQMIHALNPSDQVGSTNFAVYTLESINVSRDFLRLLGRGDVPCQWNCKQVQLQDFEHSKSTCNVWVGERQPQSKTVGWLSARQLIWTVFLFGEVCDQTLVLGHTGAICAAPITTSNYPPTRWGTAEFLSPC
jgi:hypothetical protein